MNMSFGIIQVRSSIDARSDIEDTLEMLNLGGVNNFTLVPETKPYKGMVKKVKDYTAYGEPSAETLQLLLKKRAESINGDNIDEKFAEEKGYDSLKELAQNLIEEKTTLQEEQIYPKIRLHPPRKGYSEIKKTYDQGGVLGYHGENIDKLLYRMR